VYACVREIVCCVCLCRPVKNAAGLGGSAAPEMNSLGGKAREAMPHRVCITFCVWL